MNSPKLKVALVSAVSDIYARGMRKLGAFVRGHGYHVDFYFVPRSVATNGWSIATDEPLPASLEEELLARVADCDVVGFSSMTDFMSVVRQLGGAVRKRYPKKIILLGGTHAIQAPEYALREPYLDGICVGEGELPFLNFLDALAAGRDFRRTRGFHFRFAGSVIKNPPGDYVDLDVLPFITFDDGWVGIDGRFERIVDRHLKKFFGTTFWIDRSRGCPFRCSFCIHSRLAEEKNNPVRWSSNEYLVAEAQFNLDRHPFFNCLYFADETFTVQGFEDLKTFCDVYRETIGLPFATYVDPFSATPGKIDALYGAGMSTLKMGVQSGSRRIMRDFFDRSPNYEKIIHLTRHISEKWGSKVGLPMYDLIADVPWASAEDLRDNFAVIAQFAPPFFCLVFTLTHYPGSTLFRRAVNEGRVNPEHLPAQNYLRPNPTLGNTALQLLGIRTLPKWLVRKITRPGGIAESARRVRGLHRLSLAIGNVRRFRSRLRTHDSVFLPYRLIRLFQAAGFFRTRPRYARTRSARARFLAHYPGPQTASAPAVLIDMRERPTALGNFRPPRKTGVEIVRHSPADGN